MRSVTVYRTENGEVVKTPALVIPAQESYAAISEKPMSQRVIDAYYSLECQQKPLGIKNKAKVLDIHRRALAEGR
jgi:hypothetical protein